MKKRIIIIMLIIGIVIATSIFVFHQKNNFTGSVVLNQELTETEFEISDRYKGIWPSQEHFNEYIESGRKQFRGPYISVWNSTLQREIYGSAWGMNAQTNMPESVGSIPMEEGKPYFISPDEEFNVTWVGKLPEMKTFELKYGAPESDHENYIVLPLNTEIRNSTQLCNITDDQGNRIINKSTRLAWWNISTQKVEYSRRRCIDYINRPDRAFDLEPGKVYKIYIQRDTTWDQK